MLSVLVPARNEARLLDSTLRSIDTARRELSAAGLESEVVVVDNDSRDRTPDVARLHGARVVALEDLGAGRARNAGARAARGELLVFVDADTRLGEGSLLRVVEHCAAGAEAGICRLGTFDGGRRAAVWWTFWNGVRHLPLARAKAMPAFMFCTRRAFDRFGPFDEEVALGEEWPILAGVYRWDARRFVYDRQTLAFSSSRRMQTQPFGFTANFLKYAWAVLHVSGRRYYADTVR